MAEEKAKSVPPETKMMMNYSARVVHIGGTMLVPGVPAAVPVDALDNEQVEYLMQLPVEGSDHKAIEEYTDDTKSGVQESANVASERREADNSSSAQQRGATHATSHLAGSPQQNNPQYRR